MIVSLVVYTGLQQGPDTVSQANHNPTSQSEYLLNYDEMSLAEKIAKTAKGIV